MPGSELPMTRRTFSAGLLACAAQTACAVPAARKAVVFNLEKFATHDGPGIRTVAFLKGCPLRCRWCHSPESWKYAIETYPNGETVGREMSADELLAEVLKDKDFYDASKGGVTLSGGEPLAHPDFCEEFLRKAKSAGVHTAVETSGFAQPEVIERLLPLVDLWLYDVKELDADRYLAYTTRPLAPSLANLRRIDAALATPGRIVLRCPMIPGLNDDADELKRLGTLADGLKSVARVDVEPYVPYGVDKAKRLGLKVYEAPQPPQDYGPAKVAELSGFTKKKVVLG